MQREVCIHEIPTSHTVSEMSALSVRMDEYQTSPRPNRTFHGRQRCCESFRLHCLLSITHCFISIMHVFQDNRFPLFIVLAAAIHVLAVAINN